MRSPALGPSSHCPLLSVAFADDAQSSNIRTTTNPVLCLMTPPVIADQLRLAWQRRLMDRILHLPSGKAVSSRGSSTVPLLGEGRRGGEGNDRPRHRNRPRSPESLGPRPGGSFLPGRSGIRPHVPGARRGLSLRGRVSPPHRTEYLGEPRRIAAAARHDGSLSF